MGRWLVLSVGFFVMVSGLAQKPPSNAELQPGLPEMLRGVGIEQRLEHQLPLDLRFLDESGKRVSLGDYFRDKPVVLALVYYGCPMLCTQVLRGLATALRALRFDVGKEFDIVTVSFDAREGPQAAAAAKKAALGRYKRPGAARGWHFLTGDQDSIDRLTESAGFRFKYDANSDQFAHAGGIMVLTPEGRLSRYFFGIEYAPRDLRLALVEASQNRIGSMADQLLLFCYRYDPTTGRYGAVVMNMLRIGGGITLMILFAMMLFLRRRQPGPKQAHL